jgi:hypothetical protein
MNKGHVSILFTHSKYDVYLFRKWYIPKIFLSSNVVVWRDPIFSNWQRTTQLCCSFYTCRWGIFEKKTKEIGVFFFSGERVFWLVQPILKNRAIFFFRRTGFLIGPTDFKKYFLAFSFLRDRFFSWRPRKRKY